MRIAAIAAAGLTLSGCAIFQPYAAEREAAAAPPAEIVAAGATVARTADARGPIGLSPCSGKVFPGRECWRKGDGHVLYPAAYDSNGYSASSMYAPVSAGKKPK